MLVIVYVGDIQTDYSRLTALIALWVEWPEFYIVTLPQDETKQDTAQHTCSEGESTICSLELHD